jgi:hypothetical protein
LPRHAFDSVLDGLGECGWKRIEIINNALRRRSINAAQWQRLVLQVLEIVTAARIAAQYGGLDTSLEYLQVPMIALLEQRLYRKADGLYLDDLSQGIRKGVFGPDLNFGNFDLRVKILLLPEIHDFSPWHDLALWEKSFAEYDRLAATHDNS